MINDYCRRQFDEIVRVKYLSGICTKDLSFWQIFTWRGSFELTFIKFGICWRRFKRKGRKKKRKEEGWETWREYERSWIPATFALAPATICLSRFCCQHFRSIRAWWTDDGAVWMQLIRLIWQLPLWTQSAILFTNCWFVPPSFFFYLFHFVILLQYFLPS